MRQTLQLELDDAERMLEAAMARAGELSAKVSIAVVDGAGVLLAFKRRDGAKAHTVELATRKARTAAQLGVPTLVLEEMARAGKLGGMDVVALAGGAPVLHGADCAGAVGVSGATSEIDQTIAMAAIS